MELEAAKMIGAGLAAIALAGAGVGIGIIFFSLEPKKRINRIVAALININKLEFVKDKSTPAILISGPIL